MKVSDYVAEFIHSQGIRHVFCITGGAVAHLIDSVARHPQLEYVCPHHESAAGMAVDGYARVSGGMGVAMVTTGPGVTNLLTGIACLYYDSLPSIFIAGQVSTFRLSRNAPGVRQLGFQEAPHLDLVRPITKYAALVDSPGRIRYELEKAAWIANEGRPGPVFIDICDDVQREDVDVSSLEGFTPPTPEPVDMATINAGVERTLDLVSRAEQPILVLGAAVKIAGAESEARELADRLGFPIALTWATMDMYPAAHPLNIGGFGVSSTRRGNFAIQNADLVVSVGSRLDSHATGTPLTTFARGARKVVVDIDPGELGKFGRQDLSIDVLIRADVRDFFRAMKPKLAGIRTRDISAWVRRIADWRDEFPTVTPEYRAQKGSVNPYVFLEALSEESREGDIIIPDAGANLTQSFQGYPVRQGQMMFSAFNNSPMGYSLPGAIGASLAANRQRVLCIIGDGGLQMNLQELLTVVRQQLPIKIFVFNNHGYGIIQQTQEDWLDSRYFASLPDTGLGDPDYTKIARAMGLEATNLRNHRGMRRKIREVLAADGPVLCNVELSPSQRIVPMVKAGRPIEDPMPLLDREVFLRNMIIEPLDISRS